MLYIVCLNSSKYNNTIKTICEKLGYLNYELMDPKIHDFKRSFSTVLILEPFKEMPINANKIFRTLAPDPGLSPEEKKEVFDTFKKAVEYARDHTLKKEILNVDIPRFADLTEFLNSFKGQVMELKLQDGRFIGIYPDDDKLQGKYSNEYHVSTILNLAKLLDIFNFTKLSVKDL